MNEDNEAKNEDVFTVIILIIISVVLGSVFLSNWNIPAPTKMVSEVIDDSKFRN